MTTTENTNFSSYDFLCDIPKNNELLFNALKLTPDSLVVDIGCYDGTSLNRFSTQYDCRCIGVEPIVEYYNKAVSKPSLCDNKKVTLFNYGLTINSDEQVPMLKSVDGSKLRSYSNRDDNIELVNMRCAKSFFEEIQSPIDILIVNIEGYEYELIPYMISNNLFNTIRCIQIQFHPTESNSLKKMNRIISDLKSIGYKQKFNYEMVWFMAIKE